MRSRVRKLFSWKIAPAPALVIYYYLKHYHMQPDLSLFQWTDI